ncbi:MAG: hypothetical protein GXO79_09970 [Chlorobi bacterium]|nr:hypothetical protein [Chlorobiota bacterium]
MDDYFFKNKKFAGVGVSGLILKRSKSTDKVLGYTFSPYFGYFLSKHISLTTSLNILQQKYWIENKTFVDNIISFNPYLRYHFLKSDIFFSDVSYYYGLYWRSIDKYNHLIISAVGLGVGLNYFIPEKIKLGKFTGKLGLEFYIRKYFSLNEVNINSDVPFGGDGKIGINYYFN